MSTAYNCSMCPYFGQTSEEIINHLIRRHRNESNFLVHCSKAGCGASFNKIRSFSQHLYRKHALDGNEEPQGNEDENRLEDTPFPDGHDEYHEDFEESERKEKRYEAQFLLKLTADHNLSQRAMDDIMASTKLMISQHTNDIKLRLTHMVPQNVIEEMDMEDLFKDNSFDGLESHHFREKYFKEQLGFVKPIAVKLGQELVQKKLKNNKYRFIEKEKCGYYVPFFQQLEELLKMPEIQEDLRSNKHSPFELNDIYDGTYYAKKYFQDHKDALLFIVYYDDFEIVNPIGSHRKKHKLSVFYWSLLNVSMEFRFKMQACQLMAVANARDLRKYGMSKIFEDFVQSMQELHRGKVITINNEPRMYYGTLYCVIGDTPAAQLLGGFKEGVGCADKPCRTCEVSLNDIDESFVGESFRQRDEIEHLDRCRILNEVKGQTHKYWSRQYGITKRSVLLEVPEFEVTKCILHDPMHVLLEGIVKLEIQLLLTNCIDKKKYFTLAYLNKAMKNFPYTSEEAADKPQPLERKAIDTKNTFPMSAIETRNFMMLLPFMLQDKIEETDENWINFIRILKITLLTISPISSSEAVTSLRQLICTHNYNFQKLYPNILFTPKMHYLTHLPDQILKFGPGRNHWCMRMEAKHGLFKNKKWKNFKALPYSVALHHQRWMCLRQCGTEGKSQVFLYAGDEVSYGSEIAVENLSDVVKTHIQNHQEDDVEGLLKSPCVKIRGIAYRCGSVLIKEYRYEDGELTFGIIKDIFVVNNQKYFECCMLEIMHYNNNLNAFACKITTNSYCICSQDLKYKWPQTNHSIQGQLYVMLANVDFSWD